MSVNGKTKVFGLLGNPIEHTMSPFIHQLFYDELGYNGTYNPFFVPKGMVGSAIEGMKGLSLEGLNVTVPYKVELIEHLDMIDETAKVIGACNTVVWTDGKLKGYNTDWVGLREDCKFHNVPIEGADIIVIGAGGAARGTVALCCHEKAKSITVLNRTVEKAAILEEIVNAIDSGIEFVAGSLSDIELVKDGATVFQTTNLGMHPYEERMPVEEDAFFEKVDFIVDIIYNPKETVFMKKASEFGVQTVNGLGMLFFQALIAFELWTGLTMNEEQVKNCMDKLMAKVYS